MDALLAAYRVGARVSWREMSATAVDGGLPAPTVAQFAELVFAYIDQLSAVSVAGHTDELATTGTSVAGAAATVLVVSGSLPSRRKSTAGQIADWLEAQDDSVDLGAVARTLAARNHGRSRGAVVVHRQAGRR